MSGLVLGLLITALIRSNLFPSWHWTWSEILQHKCLQLSPQEAQWPEAYQAIVCGQSTVTGSVIAMEMQRTGLLHLLVVSGSHLIFLAVIIDAVFSRLPFLSNHLLFFTSRFALLIFCLMTGFQPPVVRSFASILIGDLNRKYSLGFRSDQIAFAAGLSCLCIHPRWIFSTSLIMSWIASLGLISVGGWPGLRPAERNLFRCVWVFVFMTPLSWLGLSVHPFSILTNFLLGPLLGGLLFPASALCFLVPQLAPFVDRIWTALLLALQTLEPEMAALSVSETLSFSPSPISAKEYLWIYILVIQGIFHFQRLLRRRYVRQE